MTKRTRRAASPVVRNNLHLVDELNRQATISAAVQAALNGLEVSNRGALAGIQYVLSGQIDALREISAELHSRPAKAVQS